MNDSRTTNADGRVESEKPLAYAAKLKRVIAVDHVAATARDVSAPREPREEHPGLLALFGALFD